MKPRSQESRLAQALDRRVVPFETQDEFFALRAEGLALLGRILARPDASSRQVVSALQLAFRMRHHGDREHLVRTCLGFLEDPRVPVRTTAATLLVGAARLAEHYPFEQSPSLAREVLQPALEAARLAGLDAQSEALVRDLLERPA